MKISEYRNVPEYQMENLKKTFDKFIQAKEEYVALSEMYNEGFLEKVSDFIYSFRKEVADELKEIIIFVNGKITEVMSLTDIKNFYEFLLPYSALHIEKTIVPDYTSSRLFNYKHLILYLKD